MFLTALCPTYRHPQLLANSLALWQAQDYPADQRHLIICDDGGTFDDQQGDNWRLRTSPRFPSLPAKYNAMLATIPPETDAVLVWEDDDIYLPGYISAYARVLAEHELCKPSIILTDYPGQLVAENGTGRMHSSLGFRRALVERIGGWIETRRADFDLQTIAALHRAARSHGEPWHTAAECQYIYSWHTGAAHGQWTMRGPDDETWYDRAAETYKPVPYVGKLVPRLDERTKRIMDRTGIVDYTSTTAIF